MKQSHVGLIAFAILASGFAATARAGAPAPDTRAGDFAHVCQSGANKAQPCTVATQSTDCPGSECVVRALSNPVNATLTIIAHDQVTDWLHGGATNRALTVMIDVKVPGVGRQLLSATYQDVVDPTNPPEAVADVVSIPMDEAAVRTLSSAVSGLRFARPEATLSQQVQTLFNVTGVPVIVAAADRNVEFADHVADGLATVLRFKVRVQFVEPA